jgi:hypothetical protein
MTLKEYLNMAHFAELNSSNEVLQVIVISNEDVDANGGDESTQAETFVATIVPYNPTGVAWKQTSYNNNFRKQYAGIGYSYDPSKDMFILPQPYPSWSLDSNGDWLAPVTYPSCYRDRELTSILYLGMNPIYNGLVLLGLIIFQVLEQKQNTHGMLLT